MSILHEAGASFEQAASSFVAALKQMSDLIASTPRIAKLRDEARADMGAQPADIVYREHSLTLRHYRPRPGATVTPCKPGTLPILLVPSLINSSALLDLQPGESMVEWLVNHGHDVYLLDWGIANPGQRSFNLDFYVDHYIDRIVRRVTLLSGAPKVHVLGYCLGGTLLALYLASKADAPVASFVAMATPANFVDRGMLSWWAREENFNVDKVVNAYGNIPESFFRTTFPWIVPTGQLRKLRTIADKHQDEEFLKSFLALDIWITENVPFPGEAYRQLIRDLYQKNKLVEGTMMVNGRPASLKTMQYPLLDMVAKHDHVAPSDSCSALYENVGSPHKVLDVLEAGHLGPALGRDGRGKRTTAYWERLGKWLEEDWSAR